MKQLVWPVVVVMAVALGCGEDDPLGDAWKKFRDEDYAGAHAAFSGLVSSEGARALEGLGWTTIMMDSMTAARGYFQRAANDSSVATYAGWSLVSWVLGDYQTSVEKGEFVWRREGTRFVFSELPSVNYKDVLWHQAASYYHLGAIELCITKIKQIDSAWEDPELTDPGVYEPIILAKLEALYDMLAPIGN